MKKIHINYCHVKRGTKGEVFLTLEQVVKPVMI